ncbi:pyrroloquinoline quinone biosynthesis peptide chaperone PqqD [Rhodopseudomonas telluris]|uniref:PqqA binding protein n=1 Tax=Rhodopseudomonas telluris TaxID=644215 RepID=A0ABV6ESK9_9BRAD
MARKVDITESSRPILPRHAKLRFDETRQRWVILAPERVLAPDEIAVEILQLCDGVRSVSDIVDELAAKYTADRTEIGADVVAMLQDLADKGFIAEAREPAP